MFKVDNKVTRTAPCSSVSIVNFEQVNAGWVLKSVLSIIFKFCRKSDHFSEEPTLFTN